VLEIMNMVSLVSVEDFERHSELATVGRDNVIWGFGEVVGAMPCQSQIKGDRAHG
jgi:hypothetical protein